MRIDPKVEEPTRTVLAHAVKDELDAIPRAVESMDDALFRQCIGLCVAVAGYVTVDVLGPDWPTDAGIRRMAEHAANAEVAYELDAGRIHEYLGKSAVGFQSLEQVFRTAEEVSTGPFLMTAGLLLTFCPRGKTIWEYLDEIEEGLETADSLKPSVLPAAILRAHRIKAAGQG